MTERPVAVRVKLPDERQSITRKFNVGGQEGYVTVGLYDDGVPGEIFIVIAKEGSTLSGVLDGFATAVSVGLQHGVPLETFVRKMLHTRFEPLGHTADKEIPEVSSILDYLGKWLSRKFLEAVPEEDSESLGSLMGEE